MGQQNTGSRILNVNLVEGGKKFILNYSNCPDYINIDEMTFDLRDTEGLTKYIGKLQGKEVFTPLIHIMTKSTTCRSPVTEFIPEFSLSDTTEISMFHSFERRCKQIEIAQANFQKIDPMWDQTPFVKEIGILKIEIKSLSLLKYFFTTCDTKVSELQIIETPQIQRDIFQFQEELSNTLSSSVEKITTNKWFEKSCRRFINCKSFTVQNLPALNNILARKGKSVKNIKYVSEYLNSTITIKNAFVALNEMSSTPFFCESITAHFSKEDISIEGDGSYMIVGGKMIDIKGISYDVKSEKLTEVMNSMKNEGAGTEKLIILLQTKLNSNLLSPLYKSYGFLKQVFDVKTSSKYVDVQLKKANCQIELKSDSNHSLVYDEFNQKFIQFIKVFLQGR